MRCTYPKELIRINMFIYSRINQMYTRNVICVIRIQFMSMYLHSSDRVVQKGCNSYTLTEERRLLWTNIITVTLRERHGVSINSLFNSLLRLDINAKHYEALVRGIHGGPKCSPVARGFLSQGQWCGNYVHIMTSSDIEILLIELILLSI